MALCKYLCGSSHSLKEISGKILKDFCDSLLKDESINLSPVQPLDRHNLGKSASTILHGKIKMDMGPSKDQILERGQKLFILLADFLFDNDSTLYKLVHKRIFSKVIDGKEYQLIKLDHFYEMLQNAGFELTPHDCFCIENLIKPVFSDIANVDDIRYVFGNNL